MTPDRVRRAAAATTSTGASSRPSLGEEARSLARERIVQGAMSALTTSGLDATVDEIARRAGVSRRTVFRHFPTHDELLVAAVDGCRSVLDADRPAPPEGPADVAHWLATRASYVHSVNHQTVGPTLWDTQVERPGTTTERRVALNALSATRYRNAADDASRAWSALECQGSPPPWVVDAFALALSPFATCTVAGPDPAEAGRNTSQVLMAVLDAARGG